MKRACVAILTTLALTCVAVADAPGLPPDFVLHPETFGGIGGGASRAERAELSRYPIVFVADEGCDPGDWFGSAPAESACRSCDLRARLLRAGFRPVELWGVRIAPAGARMPALEYNTDDIRRFIESVLRYTGAPKVQIVAQGAGGVLVHWTLKKYNLYSLVHAVVYVDAPLHGRDDCDWERCVTDAPVCCSLTPDSNFLRNLYLPSEAPDAAVKYLTIAAGREAGRDSSARNGRRLLGVPHVELPGIDPRGALCADSTFGLLVPFLSDPATPCTDAYDVDGDGFCAAAAGWNDCDDARPDVHPGAEEVCEDGVDQDCNGFDFACKGGRDIREEAR